LGRENGRTNCLSHRFRVDRGRREELERFIDSMIERKRRGEKIHTSEAILNYQRSLLRGEHVEWTCMAGNKLFLVSAQGKFWICSMRTQTSTLWMSRWTISTQTTARNRARKVAVFIAQ
jgi:hypothetical protein